MADTQVLIVGGGPVGLTLAIDLGMRGIRCTLVEQKEAPAFLPKMERCNARTMEIFRRMGLSQRIRAAGLPADCPMDVFIILSLIDKPLMQTHYPSVTEYAKQIAGSTDASQPREPYQLISQYTLEPLLKKIAEELPTVSVRFGHELTSFADNGHSVTGKLKRADGTVVDVTADYMVGCDGGASTIRKALNIGLTGDGNLLGLWQALYRCDDLYENIPIGKGRHYHIADDKHTFLIVQDSTKHFTLHATVETERDMVDQFAKTIAMPMKFEMLTCAPWKQNLLVADSYGRGRVFLAGDAVHLVIPTGGLGMNSGVGDAIDIGWKLAATLKGWGGPNLLKSYEIDRRQIGQRNVAASRFASTGRRKWRSLWKPDIRDNTPEGAATREELIRVASVEQRKSNEMIGAELGYRYAGSPIIVDEDGAPEPDFINYVPTTWPGSRLPHVWLKGGVAVQDKIPHDDAYTVLRLNSSADVAGLEKGFKAVGAPCRLVDIADDHAREIYGHDLLLLRPDMHVVWRGNRLPEDPAALARLATGH